MLAESLCLSRDPCANFRVIPRPRLGKGCSSDSWTPHRGPFTNRCHALEGQWGCSVVCRLCFRNLPSVPVLADMCSRLPQAAFPCFWRVLCQAFHVSSCPLLPTLCFTDTGGKRLLVAATYPFSPLPWSWSPIFIGSGNEPSKKSPFVSFAVRRGQVATSG